MKTIVVQHSTLVNPLTTTTAGFGFPWWRAAGIAYSSFRIRETEVEQLRVGQRMKLMVCGNRLEIPPNESSGSPRPPRLRPHGARISHYWQNQNKPNQTWFYQTKPNYWGNSSKWEQWTTQAAARISHYGQNQNNSRPVSPLTVKPKQFEALMESTNAMMYLVLWFLFHLFVWILSLADQ